MGAATRSPRLQVPFKDFLRIAERDCWSCRWCGTGYLPADPWEIDHLVALANGGTNHVTNLGLCHRSCNQAKGVKAVAL
jgi:5-methylcytosine-specific restriction endonuclease McrA